MKNRISVLGLLTAIIAVVFCLVWPPKSFAHGGQIEIGGGGSGPVQLSRLQQESIGLKTDEADFRDIASVLSLNGSVEVDPNRRAHVTTRISGRVSELFASVGDHIEKGQKLALIESRQIGNPPPQVEIDASVAGVVDQRGVSLGDAVEPNTELFHVIDLSKVIVVAQVYEEDVSKIKLGQAVRITAFSWPEEGFTGKVTYIGLELDPETRTLPVWIMVDNPQWKLRAHMFVKAAVVLGENAGVLAVPKSAILSDGGEKFVFMKTGDTFDRADVQTAKEDDRYVQIKDGLVPGDEVVIQGQRELYTAWLMGGKKMKAEE